MSTKLMTPIPVRFTKKFWEKITILSDLNQVPRALLVRIMAEEALDKEVTREIQRLKRKKKKDEHDRNKNYA